MARISPAEFAQQVRQEVSRVTWPTRKETMVTTAMVFLMVFVAAGFFFAVEACIAPELKMAAIISLPQKVFPLRFLWVPFSPTINHGGGNNLTA